MEKGSNGVGVFVALLLSVVLVLMLIVTPMIFSALSILNADTITNIIVDTLTAGNEEKDQAAAKTVEVVTLSNSAQSAVADIGEGLLSDIFGDAVGQEELDAILSSNAMKELIKAYTEDMANAVTGGNQEESFTAEKIKDIFNDNIDEIVDLLKANVPEFAEMDTEELESKLHTAVDEGAAKIIEALPKPADIKQQLIENNPLLERIIGILPTPNTVKAVMIGAILLLSGLIFACRLPGMGGLCWLSADLLIGGGINAFITYILQTKGSIVNEIPLGWLGHLLGSLLTTVTSGLSTRTIVMLAAGGVLLIVYIFVRKCKQAKPEIAGREQAVAAQ